MYSSHADVLLAQQIASSAIERESFLCKKANSDGVSHPQVLTASHSCTVKEIS